MAPLALLSHRRKGNYFHTYAHTDPSRAPWPCSLANTEAYTCVFNEIEFSNISGTESATMLPFAIPLVIQIKYKKHPGMSQRQKKIYSASSKAQRRAIRDLFPATKHPRCVYLHLTDRMISRGRNSLQLPLVSTKAFRC